MEDSLFGGSRLKIKRADKHIRELLGAINAFPRTGGYRTWSKPDAITGEGIEGFEMLGKVSDDLSVIVGDVVHNLRAALDLAMCDLVRWLGRVPNDFTKFPFMKTREEVIGAVKGGVIQGLPIDFEVLIIDVIEPYKGGNDPLCALHDMDIADKHQMLIKTRAFAGLTVKTMGEDGPRYYVNFSFEQSGKKSEIRVPANEKIEGYDKPMLHVAFDRVDVFKDQSVVPTLSKLSHLVAEIIDALASECLARRK